MCQNESSEYGHWKTQELEFYYWLKIDQQLLKTVRSSLKQKNI